MQSGACGVRIKEVKKLEKTELACEGARQKNHRSPPPGLANELARLRSHTAPSTYLQLLIVLPVFLFLLQTPTACTLPTAFIIPPILLRDAVRPPFP
ncbi:hypothetical protein EYF80_032656 [Liparis tanakae]|uniref:Uncharacterized protein n=1 Tax=Liparis tanakae TaxID=230148 RepID=A0A4Z2GUN7_9TELE|nr:hypothetical protein EYF80_032656 [Liparis tanakae]